MLSSIGIHTQNMGCERCFYHILKNFLVLNPFLLDPDPYRFCQDLDPYQSSPWIRIHNKFFYILDPNPDPYQNDRYGSATLPTGTPVRYRHLYL